MYAMFLAHRWPLTSHVAPQVTVTKGPSVRCSVCRLVFLCYRPRWGCNQHHVYYQIPFQASGTTRSHGNGINSMAASRTLDVCRVWYTILLYMSCARGVSWEGVERLPMTPPLAPRRLCLFVTKRKRDSGPTRLFTQNCC